MSKQRSDMLKFSWVRSSILLGISVVVVCLISLLLFKALDLGSTEWFLDTRTIVARYGMVGIFFATFLAGTLVPLGSPALVAVIALYGMPKIPLILVSTTGFTLGMMTNYGLAYYLGRPFVLERITPERLREISHLWDRWGWPLYTVFGVIPVLPVELLSLVCGLLKMRLSIFLALTFITRLVTFTILAYLGEQAGMWAGIL